jgi:uncharacterized hydrophobic protein (TIGR00271 family)
MTDDPHAASVAPTRRVRRALASRFSLLDDKADDAVIDESLRGAVELKGSTPWILMLAIFIASIGLNVNSTAVIIGAMLVSPLMGPIMGIGYGFGIYDFALIRKSLLNLGIATAISLLTSTVYFLLTPLSGAQSELLARTSPTIWDVLIALFGGLAGAIGATRKEHSNVIPGVAIATALMPPLCTAGYGLANSNWSYFIGALYLFAINSVFIAVATAVLIEVFRLPRRQFVDRNAGRRMKALLLVITLATALPSVYLAIKLVGNEIFNNKARQFVRSQFQIDRVYVADSRTDPVKRRIDVTLIGEPIGATQLKLIESRLDEAGLSGASIAVHQAGDNHVDVASLKAGIVTDLLKESQREVSERNQTIDKLRQELASRATWTAQAGDIARELQAQYPSFDHIVVGSGLEPSSAASSPDVQVALLSATSSKPVGAEELRRIEAWFKVRTRSAAVRLLIDGPPKRAPRHS